MNSFCLNLVKELHPLPMCHTIDILGDISLLCICVLKCIISVTYFHMDQPCSEGYYKHISCLVCLPQTIACLHREIILKDRRLKREH